MWCASDVYQGLESLPQTNSLLQELVIPSQFLSLLVCFSFLIQSLNYLLFLSN
jgi:hypothetical protein